MICQAERPRAREQGLSFVTLTGLVVASMIGAGVFTTSGFALGDLGTPGRVMLAWLVGGGVALCGALSYGALARRMTESGGEYLFLSRAVHPLVGFLAGWVSLLAGFTGAIAFAASAFEVYALPDSIRPSWLPTDVLAICVVVLSGVLHGRRVQVGASSQNIAVGVKLALLAAFLLYALFHLSSPRWRGGPLLPPGETTLPPFSLSAFAVTLMWISLSYRDLDYRTAGVAIVFGIYALGQCGGDGVTCSCPSLSPGCPSVRLKGYSSAATRGNP